MTAPARSVLFVCLGNICRSPLGEGIFGHLVREAGLDGAIRVDSAGTGDWHAGDPPDPRAIAVAAAHGIDIAGQRARQVRIDDFERFDLVVAMDKNNLADLLRLCPPEHRPRLKKLRDFDPEGPGDVPDPYFGRHGFESVFVMIERSCRVILRELDAAGKR